MWVTGRSRFRAVPAQVAGWAMVARIRQWEPWALGRSSCLLVGAAGQDTADIKGDAAGGCRAADPARSEEGRLDHRAVLRLSLAAGASLRLPARPAEPSHRSSPETRALTGLGALLTVWGCYTVYLILRDPDDLTRTENHPSWKQMYLMMMAAQIGFAVAYLLPH
jgi:hypothetical protein